MPSWSTGFPVKLNFRKAFSRQKTVSQTPVPMMLKQRWTTAARRAFLLAPTEEIMAVTQVPMFWPMMMGMAVPQVTCPVEARACKMPTEAEEDWMMAVRTAPARTPRMGLENIRRMLANSGTSRRPATAPDMVSMPNISVAKPRRMVPVSFFRLVLPIIKRTTPTSAKMGVKEEGFRSFTKRLPLLMPVRLRIQAVTVVPTLAPMMTLMACRRVMRPELTKPTTMTVVAEED